MDVVALQEKISRIDGVEAARVVATNSHVEEVHILARRDKSPKQLVRDVQSLAQTLFNQDIDRRVVSIVQLADSDLFAGIRPSIVDVSELVRGSSVEIKVTLQWQEQTLVGSVVGAAAVTTKPRLIAEATINALRSSLHDASALAVASVDVPTLGSRRLAIAQVVMVTAARERVLVGASLVEDDESRAIVRSVLDALNRLLPGLRID